jgi:hypothetical protein
MIKRIHSVKFWKDSAIAVVFFFTLVSCQLATAVPTLTPVIQTVEVTQEVTRQVTREVTRIVEVPIPVTLTPTLTPAITLTPSLTGTITPTPEPPVVTILAHVACNFGPGDAYLYDYGLLETSWMEVIGRNPDSTWFYVQGVHGWNPCWVKAEYVRFNAGGDVRNYNIPIIFTAYTTLLHSQLYPPPDGVQAFRSGNKVTIYWNAVWMTEDDYRGYLVEAWLCQGGQEVFKPIGYVPPLNQNIGTLGIIVEDDPGCLAPSSARLYAAEKHGYTGYVVIPWPPYQSTSTSTPASTP